MADVLAEQWGLPRFRRAGRSLGTEGAHRGTALVLLKPQTYMNRSGSAVRELLAAVPLDPTKDLLVLVDDVALPLGTFRLRARALTRRFARDKGGALKYPLYACIASRWRRGKPSSTAPGRASPLRMAKRPTRSARRSMASPSVITDGSRS